MIYLKRIFVLYFFLIYISNIYAVSLDEMIGQMLIVGFKGTEIQKGSAILADIQNKRIGGVILYDLDYQKFMAESKKQKLSILAFRKSLKNNRKIVNRVSKNIKNPKQLKKLTRDLQKRSLKHMQLPLIISIDREGGIVDRLALAGGFPKTISQKEFAKLSEKQARNLAKEYASTLQEYGFNYVFAPVVDLEINADNPVIAKLNRSFSHEPKIVTKYSNFLIDAYLEKHIACSVKHFPGHGSSHSDSHLGFVDVTNTWVSKELDPYRNILLRYDSIGLTVMTSHVVNKNLDKSGLPATLSKDTLSMLRNNYNYAGIVVSDDLQMKAISDNFVLSEALKLAILSGNDILIFGNQVDYDPNITGKVIKIIKKLVENNTIPQERIVHSYNKILKLKKWFG